MKTSKGVMLPDSKPGFAKVAVAVQACGTHVDVLICVLARRQFISLLIPADALLTELPLTLEVVC